MWLYGWKSLTVGHHLAIHGSHWFSGSGFDLSSDLTRPLWTYCIDMDIWLLAVHTPRKENNTPDYMSKLLDENTEWRLFPTIFKKFLYHICNKPFLHCTKIKWVLMPSLILEKFQNFMHFVNLA